MRSLQDPDPGLVLEGDGRNLASVLREIERADPDGKTRIDEYLRTIVPGVDSASFEPLGPKVTLLFRQNAGQKHPWSFFAENMSDGTLRVLAILVAAYQARRNGERRVPLIGIEEPETAIHPGAAEILAEALVAASQSVQVILTTHSPDLLDYKGFKDDQILAVTNAAGRTAIASMDEASRKAVREGLYSIGDLLRMGQLEPDEKEVEKAKQLGLFSDAVDA
jgi:predicted ATPase